MAQSSLQVVVQNECALRAECLFVRDLIKQAAHSAQCCIDLATRLKATHTFSLFSPSSVEPWNQARIHAFNRPVVAGAEEYLHYSVPKMTEFSRMGGNYHLFLCAFTHCWFVRFVLKITCFSHLRNKALKFQTCSSIVSFTLQFKPSETTLNCQDNLFKCFFCT